MFLAERIFFFSCSFLLDTCDCADVFFVYFSHMFWNSSCIVLNWTMNIAIEGLALTHTHTHTHRSARKDLWTRQSNKQKRHTLRPAQPAALHAHNTQSHVTHTNSCLPLSLHWRLWSWRPQKHSQESFWLKIRQKLISCLANFLQEPSWVSIILRRQLPGSFSCFTKLFGSCLADGNIRYVVCLCSCFRESMLGYFSSSLFLYNFLS